MTGLNSMIDFVFVIRHNSKLSNGVKFQPLGLFLVLEGLKFQNVGGCRYTYYVKKMLKNQHWPNAFHCWIGSVKKYQRLSTTFPRLTKKTPTRLKVFPSLTIHRTPQAFFSAPPRCISRKWECPSSWDDHNQMTTWKIIPVSKYT